MRGHGERRIETNDNQRRGVAAALVLFFIYAMSQAAAQQNAAEPPADETTPPLNLLIPFGATVEDPVAEAKREIEASCLKVEYPKDFVRWTELNGDETLDAVIRFDVVCDGYRGAFCGAGECPGRVFVSDGEGVFRKTSLPPNVEPRTPYNGLPAVTIRLKGAECGYRVPQCRKTRVWDGADFVPPEYLTAEGRARAEARAAKRQAQLEALSAPEDADDYLATAALFDEFGRLEDPDVEARIDALEAAGALFEEPGWTAFERGERWSYAPNGRGRAQAWIDSDYGYASLRIGCRAGDRTVGLAFSGDAGVFSGRSAEGRAVVADVVIAGQARGALNLRYAGSADLWVARIEPQGALSEWLRRGSRAVFWEAGEPRGFGRPAGSFALGGSRRAIEAAYRACGLMPAAQDPVAAQDPAAAQNPATEDDGLGAPSRAEAAPRRRFYSLEDVEEDGRSTTRRRVPLRRFE